MPNSFQSAPLRNESPATKCVAGAIAILPETPP